MTQAHSIDDVLSILDGIIQESKTTESPLGYFAALYRNVTLQIKYAIDKHQFQNGPRMERLDVIFANRYLAAYFAYQEEKTSTTSWQTTFEFSKEYMPIVLQHLLMGINAHINLDLGIAAAQVSRGHDINDLTHDFNLINSILSNMVQEVQEDLADIWPKLHWLLKITRGVDEFIVDFSMKIARDGAWKFAQQLAALTEQEWVAAIAKRDQEVEKIAEIISARGFMERLLLGMIRLGEKGTVVSRIEQLAINKPTP